MNLHLYWHSLPRRHWDLHAACAGMDTEQFFGNHPTVAKRVCAKCPVVDDCLAYTLRVEPEERAMRHGVAGGMTPKERHRFHNLLREAGIGIQSQAVA